MAITPEKYVELYKKLSPRVTDEELITSMRRRGEFDPEKRVRTLCLECVERGVGEASLGLLGSGEKETLNLEAKTEEKVEVS